MSAQFETFVTELRALVALTWPDVVDDGIWENENLDMVPWDKITPPIANMSIPDMPISGDWGAANEMHEGVVTVYWIGATGGDGSAQRAHAESLRDALLTATFTAATVLDVGSVNWSDAVPVNRTFLEKDYDFRAATVSARVLVAVKIAA